MRKRIPLIVRIVTGLTLLALSIEALRGPRPIGVIAGVEIAAAVSFCLPGVWRIGGAGLLAVLAIAFAHHALEGHFASSLLFASLVVTMELAHERP
jgi:hypothetical protein